MFITLEGPEGSGKTTQIRAMKPALEGLGFEVLISKEPGSVAGGIFRKAILENELHPMAHLMAIMADRAEHVNRVIIPALKAGKIVICDRFEDTTWAYQWHGEGPSLDNPVREAFQQSEQRFQDFLANATGGLRPDLTFVFSVDPFEAKRRLQERGEAPRVAERHKDSAYGARIRQHFANLPVLFPSRCVRVDANRTPAEVTKLLVSLVLDKLDRDAEAGLRAA